MLQLLRAAANRAQVPRGQRGVVGTGVAATRAAAASRLAAPVAVRSKSSSLPRTVRIAGWGATGLGKFGRLPCDLVQEALGNALADAGLELRALDGLVACPSLADPHFMEAHFLATAMGLLPRQNVRVRTIDTGGAGPVSALLEAVRMVRHENCKAVAVVAGDAVLSLPLEEFLARADKSVQPPSAQLVASSVGVEPLEPMSPAVPYGYSHVTEYQMRRFGVTREQLAMVSVLMAAQAVRHPGALTKRPRTLDEVLTSGDVAPNLSRLECARRADGAAAVVVCSSGFLNRLGLGCEGRPVVLGGGEASGPLYPPRDLDEDNFSCEQATRYAYEEAQLSVADIDFFGLYDCFPICFIRAVEAVGLAEQGCGGEWVEEAYNQYIAGGSAPLPPEDFPVNTHGGLSAFGAPWETPAMYNIIEACEQLSQRAGDRQVPRCRRALVYGNGGVFSASSVAILGDGQPPVPRKRVAAA